MSKGVKKLMPKMKMDKKKCPKLKNQKKFLKILEEIIVVTRMLRK